MRLKETSRQLMEEWEAEVHAYEGNVPTSSPSAACAGVFANPAATPFGGVDTSDNSPSFAFGKGVATKSFVFGSTPDTSGKTPKADESTTSPQSVGSDVAQKRDTSKDMFKFSNAFGSSSEATASPEFLNRLIDTSTQSEFGTHRNHATEHARIEDDSLFPYHAALYPLLDCYESTQEDPYPLKAGESIMLPTHAPLPSEYNGHRRSKYTRPRNDPNGIHIEELSFLEGHLPCSAWSIREALMPENRFIEYKRFVNSEKRRSMFGYGEEENSDHDDSDQENDDEIRHRHNPRFWKYLLNDISSETPVSLSNMSLPPEGDEYGLEHSAQKAENARDFSFLKWWELAIVSDSSDLISDEASAESSSDRGFWKPEILANCRDDYVSILLKVLKHSMSDLQRDFKLARAVLLLLADWKLCDVGEGEDHLKEEVDECSEKFAGAIISAVSTSNTTTTRENVQPEGIACLRRLFAIISSEYISCDGFCHERYIGNGGVVVPSDGDIGLTGIGAALEEEENDDEDFELGDDSSNEESDEDVWQQEDLDFVQDDSMPDAPSHYCSDWWEFLGSITTLLCHGISYVTRRHANVLCAVVIRELDCPFEDANDTDEGKCNNKERYKKYLKQNIYFQNNIATPIRPTEATERNMASENEGQRIHIDLILAILNALRQHATLDRKRLGELLDSNVKHNKDDGDVSERIAKTLSSFNICVDAIVDIGERILIRLPPNRQSSMVGGMIVRGLVEAYVESDELPFREDFSLYFAHSFNSPLRSVADPLRYADAISNSANNPLLGPNNTKRHHANASTVSEVIGLPTRDVQDVVRALFMRELVDLRVSGCGYGELGDLFAITMLGQLSSNCFSFIASFYRRLAGLVSSSCIP